MKKKIIIMLLFLFLSLKMDLKTTVSTSNVLYTEGNELSAQEVDFKIITNLDSLNIGETKKVSTSCDCAEVVFNSSDENVAIIDSNGNITGINSGTVIITANFNGLSDSLSLTVNENEGASKEDILLNNDDSKEKLTQEIDNNDDSKEKLTQEIDNNDDSKEKLTQEIDNNDETVENSDDIIYDSKSINDKSIIDSDDNKVISDNNLKSAYIDDTANIKYSTHIQDIGWQEFKNSGFVSGTTGQSKRLEAIKIVVEGSNYSGSVEYQTHIQDVGWQEYKADGDISGTTGLLRRLEAIKIRLSGDISNYYDIYYRVHVQEKGWLGWAVNDQSAGTSGYGLRLEAIQIKIIKKGDYFDVGSSSYIHKLLEYRTHIEDIGWQGVRLDGDMSGTSGQSKRVEAIQISLREQDYSGDLEYRTYIDGIGWQDSKRNGEISGTTGQSKRIEAIQMNLTGEMANNYDIYYRTHVQNIGWLGWAKNGEFSGSIGYSYRLEAIEIKLLKKSDKSLSSNTKVFYSRRIGYSSQIEDIGWQSYKYDGALTGTTEQGKRLETYNVTLINPEYSGDILYKSYVEGIGWEESFASNGSNSGTVGQLKRIEAIQIKLDGQIADYYDVYYRVHVQNIGWLGWAKNGEYTGSIGYDYRIEALQINLLKKSENKPNSNTKVFYSRKIGYNSQIEDIGWQGYKYDGALTGTTEQGKRLETYNIVLICPEYSGDILYKSYVEGIGWEESFASNESNSGTVGQLKRIEAIQVKLDGQIADYYDVYYRVHAQNFGWLGWAKNGEFAGTYGYFYRIEAMEIKLVSKGEIISNGINSYMENVDGYFVIASALDENKVLDAFGEFTPDGSNVVLNDRIYSVAQLWRVEKSKDGTYKVSSSMNPNLYLTGDGVNVALYSKKSDDNQIWIIQDYGDGYISFISKSSNLYMDVYGANTANKTNIQLVAGNGTNAQKFKFISYDGRKIYKGIDVSSHQNVDWNVAQHSINFAIIRLGFGSDYSEQDDAKFLENIRGCEANNIPYGIYIYSYALNVGDAMSEAYHAIRLAQQTGSNFQLGIWFDMEDADGYKERNGFFDGNQATKEVDICDAFLSIVTASGYDAGLYASLSWLNGDLNSPRLNGYDKWVAHWNGPVTYDQAKIGGTSYSNPYKFWQFCSDGHISGVSGGTWDNVDLNLGYDIYDL